MCNKSIRFNKGKNLICPQPCLSTEVPFCNLMKLSVKEMKGGGETLMLNKNDSASS